jgi:hypothetical protein
MACEINASPSNGLVQSADGSGVIKLKSNGVTTNALAWVNFNGTGTVAIRSSYNVSSITDNGTGYYTVNFTTAMADANYSVVASGNATSGGAVIAQPNSIGATWQPSAPTTSSCTVILSTFSTMIDVAYVNVAVFGN